MGAGEQRDLSRVPPELRPHCFKPGESGNPDGRPKGSYSIVAPLRELLAEDGGKRARALAERLLAMTEDVDAESGCASGSALGALREILERADGKVEKQVRNTGEPTVVVINGPKPVAPPLESP